MKSRYGSLDLYRKLHVKYLLLHRYVSSIRKKNWYVGCLCAESWEILMFNLKFAAEYLTISVSSPN